ncbi:hypothetical protein CLV24_11911 [Pontibacter ummariensis]|uniref:Uncharacterized protein n=1 Tax=Pontibacter ummariensis TaxID=1610492 RepID=A0A239IU24_9BACT|nr:hypothetical protein CLV24_11911 [Pontibacter ummariensis]SNS97120.1 hypothetical protein SAMN06296052_11911 [Pontibacter ummariensis]
MSNSLEEDSFTSPLLIVSSTLASNYVSSDAEEEDGFCLKRR